MADVWGSGGEEKRSEERSARVDVECVSVRPCASPPIRVAHADSLCIHHGRCEFVDCVLVSLAKSPCHVIAVRCAARAQSLQRVVPVRLRPSFTSLARYEDHDSLHFPANELLPIKWLLMCARGGSRCAAADGRGEGDGQWAADRRMDSLSHGAVPTVATHFRVTNILALHSSRGMSSEDEWKQAHSMLLRPLVDWSVLCVTGHPSAGLGGGCASDWRQREATHQLFKYPYEGSIRWNDGHDDGATTDPVATSGATTSRPEKADRVHVGKDGKH